MASFLAAALLSDGVGLPEGSEEQQHYTRHLVCQLWHRPLRQNLKVRGSHLNHIITYLVGANEEQRYAKTTNFRQSFIYHM